MTQLLNQGAQFAFCLYTSNYPTERREDRVVKRAKVNKQIDKSKVMFVRFVTATRMFQVVVYAWKWRSHQLVSGCGPSTTTWPLNRRSITTGCTWPGTMATQVTLSTMTTMWHGSQTGWLSVHRTLTTTRRPDTVPERVVGGTEDVRHPA